MADADASAEKIFFHSLLPSAPPAARRFVRPSLSVAAVVGEKPATAQVEVESPSALAQLSYNYNYSSSIFTLQWSSDVRPRPSARRVED